MKDETKGWIILLTTIIILVVVLVIPAFLFIEVDFKECDGLNECAKYKCQHNITHNQVDFQNYMICVNETNTKHLNYMNEQISGMNYNE